MKYFDLIVIGGGPGGYPAAIRAAQLGAKTALVESEQLGGTCLNHGCIPTKTLCASVASYVQASHAGDYGVSIGELSFDYPAMITNMNTTVARLRNGVKQLLAANGVATFSGIGSFEDSNTICVSNGNGEETISAKNIIIATGSRSRIPKFLPQSSKIVDSRAFLERTELPKRLLILGGGYIGCELACIAAQLGVQTTIIELLDEILVDLDDDLRRELKRNMKQMGIAIHTGVSLKNVIEDDTTISGRVGEQTLTAELMLVATGREPVLDSLKLEKANVQVATTGYIKVDETCRTSSDNIFAVGDVTGGIQLAHAATSQGILVAEKLFGTNQHPGETIVPAVFFTSPEIGMVGITEKSAAEEKREIITGKFMFSGLGRAHTAGQTQGFVKLIADTKSKKIIGAQAIGPRATDLIAEPTLAIRCGLSASDIGNTIHAHPTFSEVWMEAAHALGDGSIHAPPRKH